MFLGVRWYLWPAYVAASVLGAVAAVRLNLPPPADFSPWYPPAGLALGVLVVVGWRAAPIVFLTRLLGVWVSVPDVFGDGGAPAVVVRAVVIVAVYTAAAEILRRIGLQQAHLTELGWLAVVGVIGAPVAAAAGTAVVGVVMDGIAWDDALEGARTFWVGDAVAVATFTPFLLLANRTLEQGPISMVLPSSRRERVESAVQAIALVIVPVALLYSGSQDRVGPALALALFPAVWVAARHDLLMASAGVVVVNTTVAVVASFALEPGANLVDLQIVMLAAALAADYVGAALRTRSDERIHVEERTERFAALERSSPDLIVRFDPHGHVASANRGDEDLIAAVGSTWAAPGSDAWSSPRTMVHDWSREGTDGVRWYRTRIDVERGADGTPGALLTVTSDTTDLRLMERQIAEAVARDELTGLASLAALMEYCTQMRAAEDDEHLLTLVAVDLDRFGAIRESLGEGADALVRVVASALSDAAPHTALVARTGDVEFVVAHTYPADVAVPEASVLAGRLLEVVHGADRRGRELLTATVGVAVADPAVGGTRSVLEDARLAVRAGKETGRDKVVVFDGDHRRAASDRRALLDALRRALDAGEFRVLYQPVVALPGGGLVGAEALVRWERPGRGLLPPAEFLGLAERSGLVVDLGAMVLDHALAALASWPTGTVPDFLLGVNVSAQQLVSDAFVATVERCVEAHDVDPSMLCFELTETSLLADPVAAVATLTKLRQLGAKLALDDFGAGYASIGYLRTLPLDILKIDQSFVAGLPDDGEDTAIVRFVTGLADTLGLQVVAEGIERVDQARALADLGCTGGQGYLYSRPLPPEVFAVWFNGGRPRSG